MIEPVAREPLLATEAALRGIQTIGTSAEGRPIHAEFFGPETASLRVLFVAGQHGDEPGGRAAAARLAEELRHAETASALDARVAIIADANPDGASAGARTASRGADLNRDHLPLATAEVVTIHRLIRLFRPDLVVDVHNYPSRRKHLLAKGWILDTDVMIGLPTNPAIRLSVPSETVAGALEEIAAPLRERSITVGEYRLFQKSGRVRPSTLSTVDLRNSAALRWGILSMIVEGRSPRSDERAAERERLIEAELAALREILAWAGRHRNQLHARLPELPHEGEVIPIRAQWAASGGLVSTLVRDATTGERRPETVADAVEHVRVTRSVRLPRAYAVPREARELLAWLGRHGFQEISPPPGGAARVEVAIVTEARAPPGDRPGRTARARLGTHSRIVRHALSGYHLFPVEQPGGHALAVWLEPESKFGLAGDASLGLRPVIGSAYPVLRLLP